MGVVGLGIWGFMFGWLILRQLWLDCPWDGPGQEGYHSIILHILDS